MYKIEGLILAWGIFFQILYFIYDSKMVALHPRNNQSIFIGKQLYNYHNVEEPLIKITYNED
jgi:hypothetical protein